MAEDVIVELFPCTFAEGGEWTVPAGSRVALMLGWGAKNQGLMHNFFRLRQRRSRSTAPPPDLSDSYSAIEPRPEEGDFVSRIHYDTGVTLSGGESLQVDGMLAVSNVVPDVRDETTHRAVCSGPRNHSLSTAALPPRPERTPALVPDRRPALKARAPDTTTHQGSRDSCARNRTLVPKLSCAVRHRPGGWRLGSPRRYHRPQRDPSATSEEAPGRR